MEYYSVEKILKKKKLKGKIHYLIKWCDYPDEHNTWEPIENLSLIPHMIEEFNLAEKRNRKLEAKNDAQQHDQYHSKGEIKKRRGSFSRNDRVESIVKVIVDDNLKLKGVVKWDNRHLIESEYDLDTLHDYCPRQMCQFYRDHLYLKWFKKIN